MSTLWVLLGVKVIEEEPSGFWTTDENAEGNKSLSVTRNINFLSSTRTFDFHLKYDFTYSYTKPTDVYPNYSDDYDYLEFSIGAVDILPDGEHPNGYENIMISYTRERLEGYSWDANYKVHVPIITTELHETELHAWQMATDIPSHYDGMSYFFNNYYGSDNVTITLYLFNDILANGLLNIKKSKFTDWMLQNGSMDGIQRMLKFQEEKLGYHIVFTSREEGVNSETLGFSYIDSIKSIVKDTANNVVSYYSNQGIELAWDDFKSTLLSEGESVVQNLVEKLV